MAPPGRRLRRQHAVNLKISQLISKGEWKSIVMEAHLVPLKHNEGAMLNVASVLYRPTADW